MVLTQRFDQVPGVLGAAVIADVASKEHLVDAGVAAVVPGLISADIGATVNKRNLVHADVDADVLTLVKADVHAHVAKRFAKQPRDLVDLKL